MLKNCLWIQEKRTFFKEILLEFPVHTASTPCRQSIRINSQVNSYVEHIKLINHQNESKSPLNWWASPKLRLPICGICCNKWFKNQDQFDVSLVQCMKIPGFIQSFLLYLFYPWLYVLAFIQLINLSLMLIYATNWIANIDKKYLISEKQ